MLQLAFLIWLVALLVPAAALVLLVASQKAVALVRNRPHAGTEAVPESEPLAA